MFKMRDKCKQLTAINLSPLSLLYFYSFQNSFSPFSLFAHVFLSLSLSLYSRFIAFLFLQIDQNWQPIYIYIYVYMYMNGRFSLDISLNATYSVR